MARRRCEACFSGRWCPNLFGMSQAPVTSLVVVDLPLNLADLHPAANVAATRRRHGE